MGNMARSCVMFFRQKGDVENRKGDKNGRMGKNRSGIYVRGR